MQQHKLPLIVRLPNWVGDMVMALPALAALRTVGFQVHAFGKPWIFDLLAATNYTLHQQPARLLASRRTLMQLKTNRMLLFTNSLSSALSAMLARKKAIGYQQDGRGLLLATRLKKSDDLHEVEYFWQLAKLAAETWLPTAPWPSAIPKAVLPIAEHSQLRAQQVLAAHHITTPYWVLCPFAYGKSGGQEKIWPHWVQLAKDLRAASLSCVICPGPREFVMAQALQPYVTVLDQLSLSEYAAILAGARQVVANDSGPMHMAAAVNTNVLGIFGVSSPQRTAPWGGAYVGSQQGWPSYEVVVECLQW